jgi:hypothetical protein
MLRVRQMCICVSVASRYLRLRLPWGDRVCFRHVCACQGHQKITILELDEEFFHKLKRCHGS